MCVCIKVYDTRKEIVYNKWLNIRFRLGCRSFFCLNNTLMYPLLIRTYDFRWEHWYDDVAFAVGGGCSSVIFNPFSENVIAETSRSRNNTLSADALRCFWLGSARNVQIKPPPSTSPVSGWFISVKNILPNILSTKFFILYESFKIFFFLIKKYIWYDLHENKLKIYLFCIQRLEPMELRTVKNYFVWCIIMQNSFDVHYW